MVLTQRPFLLPSLDTGPNGEMFSYLWLAGALRPAQVGDISTLRICVTLYFGFYKAVKGTFATEMPRMENADLCDESDVG